MTTTDELSQRLLFAREIDKLKDISRQSYLFSQSRKENSAEHSWHLPMLAMVLEPHSNIKVDINKVIKMLLLHDIVEIDAGDLFVYHDSAEALAEKHKKEIAASERIFGLLPEQTGQVFISLWKEFEAEDTPESRFANALDRVMPLMHNIYSSGRSWSEHGVKKEHVLKKNSKIGLVFPEVWEMLSSEINNVFTELEK